MLNRNICENKPKTHSQFLHRITLVFVPDTTSGVDIPYLNDLVALEGVFLDRLSIMQVVIVQYRTGLFYPGDAAVV